MTMEVWAFCLLLALAVWTAGISGYLIFGPLTFRHLLDRGQTAGLGGSFVAPAFLRWLFLRRGYRGSPDRNLTGLAAPAWVLGWCMWIGGAFSLLFLFWRP